MFSGNDKISQRQVFRLLTFDLLGLSTLLVPTVLAKTAGRDGIFCIVIGVFAGLLFLKLLKLALADMGQENLSEYLTRHFGIFGGRVAQTCYLIYLLLLAGYTAYLFAAVILKALLREASFTVILLTILLLAGYGLVSGIEGRARVYELLFWFLMIPLFLMLFSAFDEIDVDYWTPVFSAGGGNVLAGSYYVFICISLVFLVLFLGSYVEKKEKIIRGGTLALLVVGAVHVVLYLVLLGIFGGNALATMEFPAVTLMSTVRISGGFLKRTDAFMFGIWFFTLYALLNSAIFYSGVMFRGLIGKKKCLWTDIACLVLVLILALLFYQSKGAVDFYELFLWYVGTPVIVLIPAVLAILAGKSQKKVRKNREEAKNDWTNDGNAMGESSQNTKQISKEKEKKTGKKSFRMKKQINGKVSENNQKEASKTKRKWKNAGGMALAVLFAVLLSGCGTPELEDRNFPIEVAVTDAEHFNEEWLEVSEGGNRVVDYSHLKVLILNEDFVENEKSMTELLELLEKQNEVPRNTYVAVAEDADKIMGIGEIDGQSVGTYIEELFENVSEIDKEAYPTIGSLYQEQENRMETLFIPYLVEEDGKPVVESYYVWKRGEPAGRTDTQTALLSFFTGNDMKKYTLSLEQEYEVELFDSHNEIQFSGTPEQKTIEVNVRCKGRMAAGAPGKFYSEKEMQRMSQEYMNRVAAESLGAENAVDVANSYKKIGGYQRDWYSIFAERQEGYEEDMNIVYHLEIVWVNL